MTVRKNHSTQTDKSRTFRTLDAFIKGMFQDTLDNFLTDFTPREKFVVHNDSDLYSSTLFTLVKLHRILKKEQSSYLTNLVHPCTKCVP